MNKVFCCACLYTLETVLYAHNGMGNLKIIHTKF
jgi:hypothetical protein